MSDRRLKWSGRRRLPALLAALAIAVTGVAWAGCGSDDGNSSSAQEGIEKGLEEAKQGVEKGAEEVEEGLSKAKEEAKKGVEKGKEEAQKGIEKGKEEAQKGIEEGERYEDEYTP